MKITLEMLGAMKKPMGQGPVEVEIPDGTSVEQFMTGKLGYSPGHVDMLAYYIDDRNAKPSAPLTPGCQLKVLMIIGGG